MENYPGWRAHYKQTKAYLEKVSQRSRRDYERTMLLVTDLATKKGDHVGDRKINAITPVSADKIYERIIAGSEKVGSRMRFARYTLVKDARDERRQSGTAAAASPPSQNAS